MRSVAGRRVLATDAAVVPLGERKADPLSTAQLALLESGDVEVGIWEAGPGEDVDVEVDEVFLVLAGAGEVAFEDGASVHLAPGALVRLHAGERTSWRIDERLRKVYVATTMPSPGEAAGRLVARDVASLPLTGSSRSGHWVIGGWPTASFEDVATLAGARVSVWETTAGVAADIEQDECLLVLAGSGTVRFEDGEAVDLRPGLFLRLRGGERAEWQVSTDLRALTVAC